MGHESLDITDRLYGKLASDDVKKVIIGIDEKLMNGD